MMSSLTAFPTGIFIATVANLTGIGGGILWIPFFVVALGVKPHSAVMLSLCIQVAGQGSASIGYYRKGQIDIPLALMCGLMGIPGVALGAYLSHYISEIILEMFLGAICLIVAFNFVLAKEIYGEEGQKRVDMKKAKKIIPVPLIASIGSGLLSVGVGDWLIPVLKERLNLKMSHAVATAIGAMLIISTSGVIFLWLLTKRAVDFEILLWACFGVILGGQIAPMISERLSDFRLKELFIFLLMLSGIHILFNAL